LKESTGNLRKEANGRSLSRSGQNLR